MREQPLLDEGAGAPAAAVDDLLVRQHGLVDRVPIDPRLLAVGKTGGEEVGEHLLLVPVIVRMAGRDLALPVIGQPHALQLATHRRDVLVCPVGGMNLAGDRRVLGGEAERIPAHRVQHVEALRALIARDDVAHRVVAHVADMQLARRVGEHLEDIVFRARAVDGDVERAAFLPDRLPLRFAFLEIIARHRAFPDD